MMKGGVFALGNFDGVHRGHRAVIEAAVAKARQMGVPARVLTFEPHPRAFFQPKLSPFRLTPQKAKERLLKALGVDAVETLPFTAEIALMPAKDFIDRVVVEKFGAQHLVAGHDFVFGHNRDGDMKKISAWLSPHRVGVTEIEELGDDGEVFSSTRVRELLLEGEVGAAAKILGRDFSIEGTIIRGFGIGKKTIGFPTANIGLNGYIRPKFGVYAVRAGLAGQDLVHHGVANIGQRPTVNGEGENLEAHLSLFNKDIRGQEWEFALLRFIRPERKFDSLEELTAQIKEDIVAARQG